MTMHAKNRPACLDEHRRADVRLHPTLNGIDFVEYFEDRSAPDPVNWRYWVEVNFLKAAPGGLVGNPGLFTVEGGVRIVGVKAIDVLAAAEPKRLLVFFDQPGDFSIYVLRISSAALDPELAAVPFSFKAGCPSPFDCRQEIQCPPESLPEPFLDYLAKDYASFRRLLLDFISQRNPRWIERNPADLGIALVELFAYLGDNLSYFQDAVANEAYLDTCRQRVSALRHARLIDYKMHDGRNGWTFVQFDVTTPGTVPQGTKLLTRIVRPILGQVSAPGPAIPAAVPLNFEADPAFRGVESFETAVRVQVSPDLNVLYVHTFGNRNCCLAKGTTEAHLYGLGAPVGPNQAAFRPQLEAGDYLLFEEVIGPETGLAADADPQHRQVVRLIEVETTEDRVYQQTLLDGKLQLVTPADEPKLPLLKVTWREEDALTFPLCLSTESAETGPLDRLSVVRGNVIPCDHGRTVSESLEPPEPDRVDRIKTLQLSRGPLTFQAMPAVPSYDDQGRLREGRYELSVGPRDVAPAVVLIMQFPPAETEIWEPVPHLFDSRAFDRHFVVEVGNDGRVQLRFGDDEYGRRPLGAQSVTARYRIGNGRSGNLGTASLVHIVEPQPGDMVDPSDPDAPLPTFPSIEGVRQPLPATGGTDPETIEEVRQLAPRAFHSEQFRAVTESDYEMAAMKLSGVAAAKCTFRWTGSWHTVFVALHPTNPNNLITEAGGRTLLSEDFARGARAHLTRYKLAGYDLEIRTAQYVPLKIEIELCVSSGHFRGDVLAAVGQALSNRRNADGILGFFHPLRFAFGQSVYLSQLYQAVVAVEGVEAAVVLVFQRYWHLPNNELETGVIPMGPWEIPRLDNDPNFAENGQLTLTAVGGL